MSKKIGNPKNKKEMTVGRVVINLNREEYESIDKIGKDALWTTGRRLTNNKIIRAVIGVFMEIGIEGKGLRDEMELKERIRRVLNIGEERREFKRFRKGIKVMWREIDSEKEYETGKTIDIGEGGFRIELKERRDIGDNLEFTILEEKEPDDLIKAYGRIVWMREKGKDKGIEAGIQLTYIAQGKIEKYNGLFYNKKEEKEVMVWRC